MIENKEITYILRLQDKAYYLLKWLANAMEEKFISPRSAHDNMNCSEAAANWISEHILNLPAKGRPNLDIKNELMIFSNLFSAFLETSFNIVENPGEILYSPRAHCFCPMCSWLVKAPYLKTKKIKPGIKKAAKKYKKDVVLQLAIDNNIDITDEQIEVFINNEDNEYEVSLVAYATELINRSKGFVKGPVGLALWRSITWTKEGSPIKNFDLKPNMIMQAQEALTKKLNKDFSDNN